MILLFEEYLYLEETVRDFLPSLSNLYKYTKTGKVQFECVGYSYSQECKDVIFILPKVLIKSDYKGEKNSYLNKLAFGKFQPEDIIYYDRKIDNNEIEYKEN